MAQVMQLAIEVELDDNGAVRNIKAIEDAEVRKIIIGSSSEIHPNIPVENAMAMYETARDYKL